MASPTLQPSVDPDVDTQNADRPLRIIAINEDGTNFRLIEPNLQAIIKRVEAINANHVAIVSVVGAFRTGKSFLLDLFLRYLRFTSTDQADSGTATGGLPAWLQSGGDRLMEGNAAAKAEEGNSKPGFDWRPGKERTTTGIWMYGTPFARTLPSGEKIGVILMDTQGMFDMQTDIRLTAAIFGLSTLISSYQIYNITKQIQEDYLEQLDYFTQFSLVALKEFDKAAERMKAKGAEAKEAQAKQPFQTVELLVRDWQNFADDSDVEKCISEMQPVLDAAMRTQSKTAGATRDQIRAAFENINCFMLPHPGTAMIKLQYKGDINVIEKSFINLVDLYVHRVFEEKLVMKKIQGRAVSPHALLNYIKAYADVFKDGQMPKPMTLVEAMSLTTNLVSRDDALQFYKNQMNQHTSGSGYIPKQELFDLNQRERVAALEKYDELACFGSEEAIAATRKDLEKQLDEAWDVVQKANEYKIQGSLAPFIIPFIAAMLALILDTVTDYTCDAWSDSCRKLSHWSALLYYVVFAALGYKLFLIYREQGPLAVGVGFMGLGQAAALKVSESIEDLQLKLRSKVAIAPAPAAETKKTK